MKKIFVVALMLCSALAFSQAKKVETQREAKNDSTVLVPVPEASSQRIEALQKQLQEILAPDYVKKQEFEIQTRISLIYQTIVEAKLTKEQLVKVDWSKSAPVQSTEAGRPSMSLKLVYLKEAKK